MADKRAILIICGLEGIPFDDLDISRFNVSYCR